jgi:hypothetical protein
MFLSAVILARLNGHEFSQPFMERLEKMVEFVMYITKPDGTAPLIGDNDNGRLHRLKVWDPPDREWTDFRYLLAIGAVLFEREDFALAAGDQWEEAIWLLGKRAVSFRRATTDEDLNPSVFKSHGFADSGVYVMRHKDYYMIVDAGPVGQGGNGGHAHNDTLGFDLFASGQAWIVDPGTYVYTADYEARKDFRSTNYHNSVKIDGAEMNDLDGRHPFSMSNQAHVTINQWITTAEYDYLDAEHTGYQRLPEPAMHRRQIYFDKRQGIWSVQDVVKGRGSHLVCWYFNLAPDVNVSEFTDAAFMLTKKEVEACLVIASERRDLLFRRLEGKNSPTYGRRSSTWALEFSSEMTLPSTCSFVLYPSNERPELDSLEEALQLSCFY